MTEKQSADAGTSPANLHTRWPVSGSRCLKWLLRKKQWLIRFSKQPIVINGNNHNNSSSDNTHINNHNSNNNNNSNNSNDIFAFLLMMRRAGQVSSFQSSLSCASP